MPVFSVFFYLFTFFGYWIFIDIFLEIRASVLRKTSRIDPRTPEGPDP